MQRTIFTRPTCEEIWYQVIIGTNSSDLTLQIEWFYYDTMSKSSHSQFVDFEMLCTMKERKGKKNRSSFIIEFQLLFLTWSVFSPSYHFRHIVVTFPRYTTMKYKRESNSVKRWVSIYIKGPFKKADTFHHWHAVRPRHVSNHAF